MAIAVTNVLANHGEILEEPLCQAFVTDYDPARGYGLGARRVLNAMESGGDYRAVAARHFPGGSYGNGAAMRVAPVGIYFRNRPEMVHEQARLSALPTHVHPLGIEGAQLIASAVALASNTVEFNRSAFFDPLLEQCQSPEYQSCLLYTSPSPRDLSTSRMPSSA